MKYFLRRYNILIVLLLLLQSTNAQQKIDLLEYGIDAVPAYGQGTPITVSSPNTNLSNISFNANIASVSEGIHTLWVRSRSTVAGDSAKWSVNNYQYFFKSGNIASSLSNIDKLEYFIDTDPGEGKANTITVTPASQESVISFSPDIASLANGFHVLFIRSLDASGKWSITNYTYFYKLNNISETVSNINKMEYFIDTDPGIGKASLISLTPATNISGLSFNADIGSLVAGFHVLFIRSLDASGKWSITNYTYFYKQNSLSANVSTISKMEYFIDTDPGIGKANPINLTPATNISGLSFNADISSLAKGFHILFIRSLDASGKWSITNNTYFYKSGPQNNSTTDIVKIEYFIDTDPGYFKATNIPVTAAPDIANQAFTADIAGLSEGTHYLDIRSLDSRGNWSLNAIDTFNILGSVPLRLLNFSAMAEDTFVNVSWQTAYEDALQSYEVEHSTDGVTFTKIGSVSPTNNPSGNVYLFKDIAPSPGENFYRLKIIEDDGSFSYSVIKVVRFDNGNNYVSVYPNPAKDNVNILFKEVTEGNIQLQLDGINGQVIQSTSMTGLQLKELDVSKLADGIYELHIISAKINVTQKIIVQH